MRGFWHVAVVALCVVPATVALAAAGDPTGFAATDDIRRMIASMDQAMKPGQGFAWQPLVRGGDAVAAIEIWKAPGRPAIHPAEAEYSIVLDGEGTLVSGGTLIEPKTVKPGLVDGSRIEGGTSRPLRPGDVLLIPAGTPHWFGITGTRLVLLGTKLPQKPDDAVSAAPR